MPEHDDPRLSDDPDSDAEATPTPLPDESATGDPVAGADPVNEPTEEPVSSEEPVPAAAPEPPEPEVIEADRVREPAVDLEKHGEGARTDAGVAAPLAGPRTTTPAADPDHAPSRSSAPVLIGVVLALVGLLGALFFVTREPDSGPAFTAFGEETSRAELRDQLEGILPADVIAGLGADDATAEQLAGLAQGITSLITTEVLERAADDGGITVTEEEVDAEVAEIIETGFDGDLEAFEAQLATSEVSLETARAQLRSTILAERLVDAAIVPVAPETVRETYDLQFDVPTVSHILTETEEDAQAALDRVEAGEDFATVAMEVSTDGSAPQGGELGPLAPGTFVPEFEEVALDLATGEVSDPVETQFGFHIITVGEPVPFEDVEEALTAQLEERNITLTFTEILEGYEEQADISVDPTFGEWVGIAQGGVIPAGLETEVQDLPALPADGS